MTVIDLEELAERMIWTVRNGGTNEEIKREFMHSAKLLKEQEPVKPKAYYHGEHAPEMFSYDCGCCIYPIERRFCYCPGCGRKVNWDG